MMFGVVCTECKNEIHDESTPVYSYRQVTKWGTRAYAVCGSCKEKTHDEWIKNGWELADEH